MDADVVLDLVQHSLPLSRSLPSLQLLQAEHQDHQQQALIYIPSLTRRTGNPKDSYKFLTNAKQDSKDSQTSTYTFVSKGKWNYKTSSATCVMNYNPCNPVHRISVEFIV